MLSSAPVILKHRLESVKLLPDESHNEPELYGILTAMSVSRVEIEAPARTRLFCMAVTSDPTEGFDDEAAEGDYVLGQPTSWSAAVDALASGSHLAVSTIGDSLEADTNAQERRLFILAAGNAEIGSPSDPLPDWNDLQPILDPAQAWNAITVGACTFRDTIDSDDALWEGWTPSVPRGELSPFSRTSVLMDSRWPYKPDVVFEGGNAATSPDDAELDTPESLQLLTTKQLFPDQRALTTANATSAAAAGVAHIGGSILGEYPGLWPETVRALIVHSAEWSSAMNVHVDMANKTQRRALLRRYGMGVPDVGRATRSAEDALTLVAEGTIVPYDGDQAMGEMKLHELPWPTEVLLSLGEAEARMRVTLSYFIHPNPSRRGWRDRYRYGSYGLRFDVRRPTEGLEEFCARINAAVNLNETDSSTTDSDSDEWLLGRMARSSGSVHSDIWSGSAADLAGRGTVAVYPVSGWWKDKKKREFESFEARYLYRD